MNPEIAGLITDLDLSLYSYEKAYFYQAHLFEFTYQISEIAGMGTAPEFSCGDWAAAVSTGSIKRFGECPSEISSIPNKIFSGLSSEGQRGETFYRDRIADNYNSLRYRPSNCFAGVFDRVPRQLNLFEDGTA